MKNNFKLLVTFMIFLLFMSCQKELNFEYNTPAEATLKADISFNCVGDSIYGDYYKDSILTSKNYVDVKLDVSLVGTYSIQSDTVNGFFLKGEGIFTKIGINTARLYAIGKPINEVLTHFKITSSTSLCELDINVTHRVIDSSAEFILGGEPDTCTGALLAGTFMQSLALTPNNTATLNITVQRPGTYSISTPVINGVSFSGSGTVAMGDLTIKLQGTGTPVASGNFNYPITFGTTTCIFSVNYAVAVPQSIFTYGGVSGNCNATPHGIYYQNTPVDQTHYVTISVNVTSIGRYVITTNTLNGIVFSASGVFTSTGIQTINLYASGSPTTGAPYPFAYTINNAAGCGFSISVSGNYIICKIDGNFTTFNDSASARITASPAGPMLSIDGKETSSLYPRINIQEIKTSGSINVDSVNVNTTGVTLINHYIDPSGIDFSAMTSTTAQANPFTLVITSLSTSIPRRIKGKFFGVIKNNNGAGPGQKALTEGFFDLLLP